MESQVCLERFFDAYLQWHNIPQKYARFVKWHFNNLFSGVDLSGKRFLDIGGGAGTYSFYAACSGAKEVICLEPEAEGSSRGMQQEFLQRAEVLGVGNRVRLLPITFQEFTSSSHFDILFCHNAVNHLDEAAVVECHNNEAAQRTYIELFKKMRRLCTDGGYLIIADASRYSFWYRLGYPNPFAPTIEWHKHQPPRVWKRLLQQAGFQTISIRWKSPARFSRIGQVLFGNEWVNYFLWSHFYMTLRAV